jgi:hypothetical protein
MKKIPVIVLFAVFYTLFTIPFAAAESLNGQSFNGATGLYNVPTGHIGWENTGKTGVDAGYRSIINNTSGITHIPAVTISLFNWIELSGAFDIQPSIDIGGKEQDNNDLLFGLKVKLPTEAGNITNPNIAIGTNAHIINIGNDDYFYNAWQPYIAVSYSGSFFSMKAETTVVFGKTIYSGYPDNNSDLDFGMGLDLILFPDVFNNAVHWIIDYANFGYSDNSWPNHLTARSGSAAYRGSLNTGFRINLSTVPALSKLKLIIDLVFNDLFDDGQRSFTIGGVIGLPL